MKILLLGELVGRCGTGVVMHALREFRREHSIDFTVAGGECVTGGYGLGFSNAQLLLGKGIDVLTTGEKAFYKMDMVENIGRTNRVLRPYNLPEQAPGKGMEYYSVKNTRLCVINMLGMFGFQNPHPSNPFSVFEQLIAKARGVTPFVICIFHSQATAEKRTLAFMLDGKASILAGLHTKVLTADAQLLPGGTAYITDLGRCGSFESVGGFLPETEIKKHRTGVPLRSCETFAVPVMQGMIVELDNKTGTALSCEPFSLPVNVPVPA